MSNEVDHEREPCFVCERREREPGQILCRICYAWGEVGGLSDMTRQQAIQAIKRAVSDARWVGLTDEEIKAVFLAAVLER
jgi:hypothetical protein